MSNGPATAQAPATSTPFLNNKQLVWYIHNLGAAYGSRPSDIVGLTNSWAAYQFDMAVLVFGRWVENRRMEGENVQALLHEDYGTGLADQGERRFRSVLGL